MSILFRKGCLQHNRSYGYDAAMKTAVQKRSWMNKTIRTFFDAHSYTEVDTPMLSPTLIPEATIENFSTRFENPFLPSKDLYLVPSPEIYMKQLIAEGMGNLYQITHCFRNSEQLGNFHNIEFSMLEYYTIDANEQDSIALTENLLASLLTDDSPDFLSPPFRRMTVEEAMFTYAKIDLKKHQRWESLAAEARKLGLSLPKEPERWEDT
ncbi:MAG: amino acid--tRNA ligase-related protein, partial [Sphaerochaetaceae bacterium]